jgi:hypothetical protein
MHLRSGQLLDDVELAAPEPQAISKTDQPQAHLLIGWSPDELQRRLVAALPTAVRATCLEPAGDTAWPPPLHPVDVALLKPDLFETRTTALLHRPEVALSELVFVLDDVWSPERFALESRGFPYLVARSSLVDWLPGAFAELCALARARRATVDALARRPAPPGLTLKNRRPAVSLHLAETRFRENYLRLLLAENGSRREAAAQAGVPYRSFCEMLRKLDI